MTSLWAWIRWEASRTIEVTGFIVFIIVERFVKGAALVFGGLALIALLVNLAVVGYLVWRKRLFLERPSTTTATSPA